MSDIRLDHVVIAVTDWERANAFYRDVCGAELVRMDDGPSTYWRYRFGEQQLNVHGPGVEPAPVARVTTAPGSADLCLLWPGPIERGGRAPARPRRRGRAGAGGARGRARARARASTSAIPTARSSSSSPTHDARGRHRPRPGTRRHARLRPRRALQQRRRRARCRRSVLDTMVAHLAARGHDRRLRGRRRSRAIASRRVYDELAALLGCGRDEIAVVENATRAWDMAFYALPFEPGDRILCARAEYESNVIALLQVAEAHRGGRRARPQRRARPAVGRGAGRDARRARQARRDHPRADQRRAGQPDRGGRRADPRGGHRRSSSTPASRSGSCPSTSGRIGCDMLSATGRKYLRGPRGDRPALRPPRAGRAPRAAAARPPRRRVGGRDRYEIRPGARRFENWEGNVAGKLGLGEADALRARLGPRGDRGPRRRARRAPARRARADRGRARPRPRACAAAGSCPSPSRAARRAPSRPTWRAGPSTSRSRPGTTRRYDMVERGMQGPRPGLGPLLQQRGRGRRARRGGGRAGRVVRVGSTARRERHHRGEVSRRRDVKGVGLPLVSDVGAAGRATARPPPPHARSTRRSATPPARGRRCRRRRRAARRQPARPPRRVTAARSGGSARVAASQRARPRRARRCPRARCWSA